MQSDAIIRDHAMFRALLSAISRPGSVCPLPYQGEVSGQSRLLGEMLHCLMDNEVTYYVVDIESVNLSDEIAGQTGARRADCATADFLIFPAGDSRGEVANARRGTLEYPDSGATVIYRVDELQETGGAAALHGPGIDGTVTPLIRGLATEELERLRDVNAEYPLGVDALFLDNRGSVMWIPRSTRIGRG